MEDNRGSDEVGIKMGKVFLKKYFEELTIAITPQDVVLDKLLLAKER